MSDETTRLPVDQSAQAPILETGILVYGRPGVRSWTQAVARARELGLLDGD
jgi:hypothetical protein